MKQVGPNAINRQEVEGLLAKIRDAQSLSEEAFTEKCLRDLLGGWIPLEQYLKMFPSETANKVYKRVQQGAWQVQVHYAAPKGSTAWVNLIAIRLWIEGQLA